MVLFGNLVSFLGCILMVAIGFIKKKEQILAAQCVQFALMGAGNLILGAMAGVISNGVSIIRNLLFTRVKGTPGLKLLFIAIQVALTLMMSGGALIEWLPVIAVVVYTWCLDLKSAVAFKVVIIGCQILWVVYDWHYLNYVAFAFDLMTIASTVMGIVMIRREKA